MGEEILLTDLNVVPLVEFLTSSSRPTLNRSVNEITSTVKTSNICVLLSLLSINSVITGYIIIYTLLKVFSESNQIKPNFDCNYIFPTDSS